MMFTSSCFCKHYFYKRYHFCDYWWPRYTIIQTTEKLWCDADWGWKFIKSMKFYQNYHIGWQNWYIGVGKMLEGLILKQAHNFENILLIYHCIFWRGRGISEVPGAPWCHDWGLAVTRILNSMWYIFLYFLFNHDSSIGCYCKKY